MFIYTDAILFCTKWQNTITDLHNPEIASIVRNTRLATVLRRRNSPVCVYQSNTVCLMWEGYVHSQFCNAFDRSTASSGSTKYSWSSNIRSIKTVYFLLVGCVNHQLHVYNGPFMTKTFYTTLSQMVWYSTESGIIYGPRPRHLGILWKLS